ncbi:hypothetical protein [Acinetobacter sp.]|uniref:hypothetical protein n=1 Tax=Acinetobacter sp. TaxID=472 RepID=UPI003C751E49
MTISVVDSNNLAVPNATVTGGFSVGGSNLNCTTNNLGQCQINSGTIKSATQTTFNINNISGSNLTMQPAVIRSARLLFTAKQSLE